MQFKNRTRYPKEKIEALKKADREFFLHPFSRIGVSDDQEPKIIDRAYKSRVFDIEGREYIDGFAGLWYSNIGHGREEIIEVAVDQMSNLDAFHCFSGFSNLPAIRLAEKLNAMVPMEKAKIFFAGSGSEANDSLFKIARLYWSARGIDSKDIIISRNKGYHGVSYGPIQATRFPHYQKGYEPLPPGFKYIGEPYCYYCPWDKIYPHCNLRCADALEEKIIDLGEEHVAAFIAEPVIGSGGVIVPPAGYYQKIRKICSRYNIIFIADEVITGFGRTAKNFGIEHWDGVMPDAMSLAKGITSGYVPLGAAVISGHIFEALKKLEAFYHGFTYSGHPLGCRVALKNIEILEREELMHNAAIMGERLMEGFRALDNRHIGEVRGKGLVAALEIVKDFSTKEKFDQPLGFKIFQNAYKNGVIVRPLDDDIIAFAPPLIITEEDIDMIVEVVGKAIKLETGSGS